MSNQSPSITSPPWSVATKRIIGLVVVIVSFLFVRQVEAAVWNALIITLVLAYLLSPLVSVFERRMRWIGNYGLRRALGVMLTWLVVIGLFALVIGLIVPATVSQLRQFADDLPDLIADTEADLKDLLSNEITIGDYTFVPWDEIEAAFVPADGEENSITAVLQDYVLSLADPALGFLGGAVSFIFTMIFVLVMLFYLMRDGPLFVDYLVDAVPESYQGDARLIFRELAMIWNAYLRGQITLCFVMAFATYIAALILGLPQPLLLALVAGFFEFIPNLGPAIAQIPALLFAFTTDSATLPGLDAGLLYAVIVSVTYMTMQQLEAMFLVPRILGGNLNLHPFVVIVSILIGAGLAGVLGVVLAAPMTATLLLIGRYVRAKLLDEEFSTAPTLSGQQHGVVYSLIHFGLSKRFPPAMPEGIDGLGRVSAAEPPLTDALDAGPDVSGWAL